MCRVPNGRIAFGVGSYVVLLDVEISAFYEAHKAA
jgi:hypothetical protein